MKSFVRMVRAVNRGAGYLGYAIVAVCTMEKLQSCLSIAIDEGLSCEQMVWHQADQKLGMNIILFLVSKCLKSILIMNYTT